VGAVREDRAHRARVVVLEMAHPPDVSLCLGGASPAIPAGNRVAILRVGHVHFSAHMSGNPPPACSNS